MKNLALLISTIFLFSSCSVHTVYLVRHANKVDNSSNSPLSEIGFIRANALLDSLRNKNIDTIFVSPFLRTQQTAQPTADFYNKQLSIYAFADSTNLVNFMINGKKNILFVGHSDTVPGLIFGISGQNVPAIAPMDYDNFYKIKITRQWFSPIKKTLIVSRYGAITP
jgi:phosphohistidine phosphatase SixA